MDKATGVDPTHLGLATTTLCLSRTCANFGLEVDQPRIDAWELTQTFQDSSDLMHDLENS